ncbi:MAG: hypothetical protein ACJ72H_22905 [Candidatus Sulfotelmatobacter sp.]
MRNGTAARFSGFAAGLVVLVASGWFLTGQAASPVQQGYPTDWSHHHLVFSRPANPQRGLRVEANPRYWQQYARRNVPRVVSEDGYHPTNTSSVSMKLASALQTRIHGDWSEYMGSGATSGAENYPAKYTFQTSTANCASSVTPDYMVFNTGLTGSSTQASIIAYENLYQGCGGTTVPETYWAYNTAGQVLTSPSISLDGTQVAFVQTNAAHLGTLVLLKWKASTGSISAPATPASVSNANYRSCAAPCMTTIILRTLGGTALDDTTSSVFPDYGHDVIWVGSAFSWLHKITGPFLGVPTEVKTGGFPVQVDPSNPTTLSSPVYDSVSGNVFVGDYGGYLHRVNSITGAVVKAGKLDQGSGIVMGPIVDSAAGIVYLPSSSDGTTACVGLTPCAALYILSTSFPANSTGTKRTIGSAGTALTPNAIYLADFDSTYQDSSNATGNIYICGNNGGPPILYRIPIATGIPGTVVAGPVLANSTAACSNLTDVYNPNVAGGATEWIYASVQANGIGRNCASSGCLFNFKDTPWLASNTYAVGQEVLDTRFQVQVVSAITTGVSGATTPPWSATPGGATVDNGVTWINQGPYSAGIKGWTTSTNYTKNAVIVDTRSNVQVNTRNGTSQSGANTLTWNPVIGGVTNEAGGPHWINVGPLATHNTLVEGGTSGIGYDNTVSSGTLLGASQIYFSTLSDQDCSSGTRGGCAVQASQSALQ